MRAQVSFKSRFGSEFSPFESLQRLRWLTIGGQAFTLYFASQPLNLSIQTVPLVFLFIIGGASNIFISFVPTRFRTKQILGCILVFDIFLLTALLFYSGGPGNPFSILYLLHVVLCAVLMSERFVWVITFLTIALFGLLFFAHASPMSGHMHGTTPGELNSHLIGMWMAYALVALITAYCMSRITRDLSLSISETQALKLNQQRLASLTTLAAGAAHELGSPLGTIAIVTQELERRVDQFLPNPEISKDLALINSQISRCREIIAKMGGCSGEVRGEMITQIGLSEFSKSLETSLKGAFGPLVSMEISQVDGFIRIAPQALTQAILALAKNGIEASANSQPVLVTERVTTDTYIVRVIDYGTGIHEETLMHVGEPFFTTKETGRGMGLGVFLARLTAESLGGAFHLQSTIGKGTTVEIAVPRVNIT